MEITKCDICNKTKKEKHSSISEKSKWIDCRINGRGEWLSFALCGKCSEKMLKYIRKYLKIKENKKNVRKK
ncbi:hypothetical protein KKF19_00035 [Patescibacteria group bacterium]|nr:hypothetical protein [Patescibacteria group bacterium]